MGRLVLVLGCLVLGRCAGAGTPSSCVVAIDEPNPVSVGLRQRADFVAVTITITTDLTDPDVRYGEIRQAKELLQQRARETTRIQVQTASVSLSTNLPSKTRGYSGGYELETQASLRVNVPLEKNTGDVYSCAAEARQFIAGVQPPGKAQYGIGRAELGVNKPEQYRRQLLQLIAQDVKTTKEILGADAKVTVLGLHGPVLVRQVDETNVELFIAYNITVDLVEHRIIRPYNPVLW